jgi:hypothetical protein
MVDDDGVALRWEEGLQWQRKRLKKKRATEKSSLLFSERVMSRPPAKGTKAKRTVYRDDVESLDDSDDDDDDGDANADDENEEEQLMFRM